MRSKRGVLMLSGKDQQEAERFVRAMFEDIKGKWVAYFVEHKHIKPERITRRLK